MDLGLDGLVVFVTGASGGIGAAISTQFAHEGALLGLHANRGTDALASFVDEHGLGARSRLVQADVADASAITRALDDVVAHFGRVDVCVVNAGIWPPDDVPLHAMDEARVRDVIDVNVLGAMWTVRAFLAALARTGPRDDGRGASIVLVGSTAGRFGERGHCEYSVSKAALYGLLRTIKNEIVALDPYGRINLVEPGWTVTPMAESALAEPGAIERVVRTMPLQQLARAEDVARAVVFLASPMASRHVTGEVLTVAGGMEGRVQWEPGTVDAARVRERLR